MIRFTCQCGRLLQAREEDVGKAARCPACQTVTTVPPLEGSSTHPSRPVRERISEEEDRDDLDDRPRRRRQSDDPGSGDGGSKVLLALGIVVLVIVVLLCGGLAGYLFLAADPIRPPALKKADAGNLKQIGLAIHNLMAAQGGDRLPQAAAIRSKDGTPLLSWRVALLPFLEQHSLYHQFRHDEPWDGPNNAKLLEKMPKVYELPLNTELPPGMTYYQVVVGKGTLFEEMQLPPKGDLKRTLAYNFAMGFRFPLDIPDGTANTILVATARNPVPWTKPADMVYDLRDPVSPLLGGHFQDGYNVLMADGSIRWLPQSTSLDTIRAMVSRNGGEVVPGP